ncbi:MOS1T transposase, partial [Pseudoatta argentina]
MSIFVPNKVYLRGILLHYFIQKKSAAEAHRILVQTYGDNALSETTCRDWFRRFKNNDVELEDKERFGAPKKFQDKELEQLLDEDPSQTLSELGKILQVDESTVSKRLKGLGMIQKQGHWVPYELVPIAKFNEFRYQLLPHPAYSPDLAPCDYFLFPNLKKWFGEKRFTSREQLIAEREAYFERFDKSYYLDGLKKLKNCWIKCIELKRDYVEK